MKINLSDSEVSLLICYLEEKVTELRISRPKIVSTVNRIKEKLLDAA